jgi:hypothetical protein
VSKLLRPLWIFSSGPVGDAELDPEWRQIAAAFATVPAG